MTETLIETTRDYTTEIELAGTGSYTITVIAIGDGETYGNSDPAENTVTITVNTASVTFGRHGGGGQSRLPKTSPPSPSPWRTARRRSP